MTIHNALAHVQPNSLSTFRASGQDVTFQEIGFDNLNELLRRFPSLSSKLKGEDVKPDAAEYAAMCAAGIAMALEPDATEAERAPIEASARLMKRIERELAFMTVFRASFPQYDEAFTESEAPTGKPLVTIAKPANRTARRATRSSAGKTKART